jgi:hypothetical protein
MFVHVTCTSDFRIGLVGWISPQIFILIKRVWNKKKRKDEVVILYVFSAKKKMKEHNEHCSCTYSDTNWNKGLSNSPQVGTNI